MIIRGPRKRLRFEGYNYSQEGLYFVTICVHNRELLLEVPHVSVMIEKYWTDVPNKYCHIILDDFVIMPNHFHGIIQIVGADLCVGPELNTNAPVNETLPRIMKWFKSQTTNAYLRGIRHDGWQPFNGSLWQRGYHDRVIRDEDELNTIRLYIQENPNKWQEDIENPLRRADT